MATTTRRLVKCAVLAALYCALTIACAPIAYGPIQFRVSELLCVLPFFAPWTVWGLTVGCVLSNLLSPAGVWDLVLGPAATLLAGLCTAGFGRVWRKTGTSTWRARILACLMPVIFNAAIVGSMLAALFPLAQGFWKSLPLSAAEVGLGEAAVMFLLGLPAISLLPRAGILKLLNDNGR